MRPILPATLPGKGWPFRVGAITDYDDRTLPGIERRDDIYFAGLAYKF